VYGKFVMDYASDFDSQGAPVRRKRRGGVSFLVIAIGTVCIAAAWVLTASNPYTELANRVVEVRTPAEYAEAEAPIGLLPDAEAERDDRAFREMIASLPVAAPEPEPESATTRLDEPAVAPLRSLASPAVRRIGGGHPTAPVTQITVPVAEFAGPPMPEATAEVVESDLTRAQRRAVQRRLRMAGHDAGASDGVFGPNTRAAIASFQEAAGFHATGDLDAETLRALKEDTDADYTAWAESHRLVASSGAQAAANTETERYAPADGCARGPDGSILEHQGLGCDLRGFGNSIRGVFARGGSDFNPTSGADR
jgi:hypothetical protein